MNKTISFLTLGCKLNYAETSTYERDFIRNGFKTVPWNTPADVCLINTCTVTEHSDKKARNIIRKMHRISPAAKIIVTGCYAELKREEISSIEGVSMIFGAKEKGKLVAETLTMLGIRCNADAPAPDDGETFAAYSSGERTRSFLKVQDGCNNFCAYCTVPFARGTSRNIPIAEAIANAENIAAAGIKEIVITGVNTGDFGRTTGESFLELLKRLNDINGIERYRISSIEPNLISDEIIDWISSGTKFLPHFHIPLQSGSDIILKSMGRHYDTSFFAAKIDYIRRRLEKPGKPKVFFGIDVIAGLPGETEELFDDGYDFLKNRIRPAFIHIFPYSRRPGTRAFSMPGQVDESVKTERVKKLESLCEELHSEFIASNKGIKEKVLFESTDKNGMISGYTGNYIRVERPYDPALAGKIIDIIL
ncbi:MAG: tRNA (N(6)-L-threonylcarbamoyladenosine(37)-C(2))-methylthiotransferase MtaB [Bacteroidales bacterium]|jgi:threonylcarbamoyladenosine tRNA methylthiotransferase MtaB|nr:tRNA (N(6)-L-threonylcarbamoyladenosine(37)-C(2))-methylthiotransferase MtaB [Bacteroidales bacterium]MCI1785922.1 tRNA (N(6)-L-threonylcarbamoyladenosine(37)-C(2))-methylthiotransferase MtaB [Bacteroidales bacterium]